MHNRRCNWIQASILTIATILVAPQLNAQEVIVLESLDDTINWLESENWWGETSHEEQLLAPRALITSISPNWRELAPDLPVSTKKEVFYRLLLPLVMHANNMVLDRRKRLQSIASEANNAGTISEQDALWLAEIRRILRISLPLDPSIPEQVSSVVDAALYKLDVIPPSLALGQGAYESGYGTSRFAAQGNALFGQWAFGGEGLVPEQQRTETLGDYRIAAYEWPFDSVRSYFLNISSHPAYEDFRRIRAELKNSGQELDSLKLAEGLHNYSERGQDYVETLQGIIRVNNLKIADQARFKDEPMKFIVTASDDLGSAEILSEIEKMRESGELDQLITRMNLE